MLGIVVGLVVGKQVGITLAAWLVVRLGWASLPDGVGWRHIYGGAWLGGIGFTMSLFVADLAFGHSPALDLAKIGILTASVIAGVGGYVILRSVGSVSSSRAAPPGRAHDVEVLDPRSSDAARERPRDRHDGLSKQYRGGVLAVDHVDLRVARGEIYAFLGLNGAGKSTTIRMLLGMIRPTAGHAELFGERVHTGATDLWRRVGHLVESATAYQELTVRENLDIARRLAGMPDASAVDRVIERLALQPYADRRAGTLSLGNLQRLALARALLPSPELLVLDEPANGLDPAGVIEIRELLRSLSADEGVTVFMSSHILGEVDRLATRVGIVHRGRLVEELDHDALEAHRDRRLEVEGRDLERAEEALRAAGFSPRWRAATDGPVVLELREPRAFEAPDEVAILLVAAGTPPTRLAVARESLEDHFIRLTTDDGGEQS